MTAPKPNARALLVIEDSPLQAKIIRKQIQALTQFEVLTAYTMAEAEQVLSEHSEELFLAVVDLNLPDAPDGEVVDLCISWNVPPVVLTATFNESIRTGFIERQVVDYFFKGSIEDMDPMVTSIERVYKNAFVTALVVDDSSTQRRMMRRLLEVQRYQVIEAEHGEEALRMLEENPEIRMVITDFQMPVMDGMELVRQIRSRRKMNHIAIIGVSAAGSGPLTAQFLKHGANDFLTKPFEVEEFYWRVNQTMEIMDMVTELLNCQNPTQ